MPNRKTKEAMKAKKRAEAQERDAAALTKAAKDDLAKKSSIVTQLPPLPVRRRKLQRKNRGSLSPSGKPKGRVLGKNEIL
jgi:hypothetical protein